ncbi:hypothetical protein BC826DRAFT_1110801 [Russula brevipes]|nr:hypothetical protein BC826DRAFT_1110801 [Russula brevipes]
MPPRRGTPWASSRGSLLSDRIRPSGPPQPTKGKGKAAATPEPPRSAAVRKLDELLAGLRSSESTQPPNSENNKDVLAGPGDLRVDRDGCFCQARAHALSEYTPLCTACGLVLCTLHPPHRPCPHCATPLLSRPARTALVAQLEELRAHTLAEEAAARERAVEALRMAEGAFPALPPHARSQRGAAAAAAAVAAPAPGAQAYARGGAGAGGRRVLSVDADTKRVKVESYSVRVGHGLEGEEEEEEDEEEEGGVEGGVLSCVRAPPRDVQYVRARRGPATRWVDLKGAAAGGGATYVVPPPVPEYPRID